MDRYKRFILKKNKIYHPYTIDGIGNFLFRRTRFVLTPTTRGMCGWMVTPTAASTVATVMLTFPTGENSPDLTYPHIPMHITSIEAVERTVDTIHLVPTENRRPRTSTTTLGTLGRVVTSMTTTTALSTVIPTGEIY